MWGNMMGWGWGGGAGPVFGLWHLAVWAALIVAVVVAARWMFGRERAGDGGERDRALAILRERYARGEIDQAEFDLRRRHLGCACTLERAAMAPAARSRQRARAGCAHRSAKLAAVKFLRVLLLALLAAMLPMRGLMAAAMPWPAVAGGMSAAQAMSSVHAAEPAPCLHAADAHAEPAWGGGHRHDADAGAPDPCSHCATCCLVPPLAPTLPTLPLPHAHAAVGYADAATAAASFLTDGPERPPRGG
jgi:putative membrane protein